jgi:hypothetical protein
MSLDAGDQGYNNGKKDGKKGTICGPNTRVDGDITQVILEICISFLHPRGIMVRLGGGILI